MSAEPDFDRIYRLLGVEPDQGWETVRHAYRQRVQALHPDKVSGDPDLVKRARQRFEQLNAVYRELRRYRDIFGDLPPTGLDAAATPERVNREWTAPRSAPRRSKKLLGFIALSLAAAAAAWLGLDHWSPDTEGPRIGEQQVRRAAEPTPAPRIALGDSLGRVLDIQGRPDRVDGDAWRYGDSIIVFEQGRVAHWETSADRPLKTVTAVPDSGRAPVEPPPREIIEVGSTKADVARIQGTPLRADESEWDYGVSKVYFEGELVVGWFNSPVDPLKVADPYERRGGG